MQANNEIKHLKLEDIIPNRLQPRTEFDEEKLNELANSIKHYGVINPLLVRQVGNKYEIVAGERRYKASAIAGLTTVPVIITNMDDNMSAEVAIIENIQRQDLSSIEEARSYRKLLDQGNITQEQLAQKMGKTQSTIANKMRLLNLCDEVQEALENNQISERHARSLLQLKDINAQREMLEKIINERMNVRTTENAIKEKIQSKTLNSRNEIIENTIIPPKELNENIYGNDVINIMDLNKKELEKENDNMNNEQNIQMNTPGVQTPLMEQPLTQTNQAIPAFGDRFFPSLEDQETNLNLTSPFEIPSIPQAPAPAPQPMMENLIDPTPVVPTTSNIVPEPLNNIPSFVTNTQTIPSMTNPLENTVQTPEINLPPINDIPVQPEPVMSQFSSNNLMQNLNSTINQLGMENANINTKIVQEPIINPMSPQAPIAPVTPTTPEPMMPPVQPEPVFSPIIEPTIAPTPAPEFIAPTIENKVQFPNFNQPETLKPNNLEDTIIMPPIAEPTIAPTPEIPPVANKTTDKIINAINALKNLGLSIESIGYKINLTEEDTPNTYKITIELEK